MLVMTDGYSRHTTVRFLRTKGEAAQIIIEYIRQMERQTGCTRKRVHSDGGREFDNNRLNTFFEEKGIQYTTTAPHSSAQNPVVERHIGIIMNDTRTLLHAASLSSTFWALAANHATYVRNRIPSQAGKTPHEPMFKRKHHLKVWGCAAYAWVPLVNREEGKLSPRAHLHIFVGFKKGTSNARLFDPATESFKESRDVRYLENAFPSSENVDLKDLDIDSERAPPKTVGAHRPPQI
jgi:hypothetical protein